MRAIKEITDSPVLPPCNNSDSLPPPPDGGLIAWTQVLCMHFVFFNTWGFTNSISVFEQLYTSQLPESPSTIGWIGGIQVFLLIATGVFAGRATDGGYFRLVYRTGIFLQLLGLFMLSLCKSYWQIFLAQGLTLGLGQGLIFSSGLSVVSTYFKRKVAIAFGLASAGGAIGGMIYPAMVDRMIQQGISFGWAIRAAALVMLITYIPGVIFFKPRLPPRTTGPLADWGAFSELPFTLYAIAFFLTFWGYFFVIVFLGSFAHDIIGVEDTMSLVMILNGVSIFGRTIPGIIADLWIGKLNILTMFIFFSGVMVYCWIAVEDVPGMYVFTAFFGFLAGALQTILPAVVTAITPDIMKIGTRLGMTFTIAAFGPLTGPSIQGALIQRGGGRYVYAQVFAGSCLCLAVIFCVAVRVAMKGWVLRVKI